MRLPVILVQNPPASGAGLAEALVGNLIGRAGLDLTLVDRLDSIGVDSTDRMTLEGITVPSAVLVWQSPDEMLASLEHLEFYGTRCPHQLDAAAVAQEGKSRRRLFLFDLNQNRDANAIVAELDRLKDSLAVKTVSLGGIGGALPKASSTSNGKDAASIPETGIADETNSSAGAGAGAGTSSAAAASVSSRTSDAGVGPIAEASDKDLDRLMDQLDDLDV